MLTVPPLVFRVRVTCHCSAYGVGNAYARAIATPLSKIFGIETINLSNNRIDEKTAAFVFAKLAPTTRNLNVSKNNVGLAGIKSLANVIEDGCILLEELNVASCNIAGTATDVLCKSIENTETLHNFDLSSNRAGLDKGPLAISKMLRVNTSITNLNLSWNKIGGEGAELLMRGLKKNASIKWLQFSHNSLSGRGGRGDPAKQLSAVFASNTTMTHLDVSYCQMGDEEVNMLAKGIKKNFTLLGLVITGNLGYMDPKGFLHVKKIGMDSFARRADKEMRNREMEGAENNDWVLEGWNEVNIQWIPGSAKRYRQTRFFLK
jgi:hypothetical protein